MKFSFTFLLFNRMLVVSKFYIFYPLLSTPEEKK